MKKEIVSYYEKYKEELKILPKLSREKLKEFIEDKNIELTFFTDFVDNEIVNYVKVERYVEKTIEINTETTTEQIIEILSEHGYDMSNYMDDEGYGVDFCTDLIELLNNKYDDNIKPKRVKRLCSSDLYRY